MNISLQGTTVLLNGHQVSGWSEDTDALTMPDAVELATVRRGATGDMAAFSTGNRGGPVSVKLLPTSPSVAFFMQQAEVMRRGLGGVERQHPQRAAEHQRDVDPGG